MTKFNKLFESVMDAYDVSRIRPQSIVNIDEDALKISEIKEDIIKKRGPNFYQQLQKMAQDKFNLYVSAIKSVRLANQVFAASPNSEFLEADLINYVPGLMGTWSQPITVPVSVLKTAVPPELITQVPVKGDERKIGKEEGDNSYNKGKQHPNTVGQK